MQTSADNIWNAAQEHLRSLLAAYAGVAVALVLWWFVGHPAAGTEIFPNVESGQVQLRLRAPTGTHFERRRCVRMPQPGAPGR